MAASNDGSVACFDVPAVPAAGHTAAVSPQIDGQVIDTFEFGLGRNFPAWLGMWRARWLAGERIRVLVNRTSPHAVVVVDLNAKRPPQ